jgi:hypothetical protein
VLFGQPRPLGLKLETPPGGSPANPKKPRWVPHDPEADEQPGKGPLAKLAGLRRRHRGIAADVDLLDTIADSDTEGNQQ